MLRIGIICPSEIALRRFLPALQQSPHFTYAGVAYATTEEWFGTTQVSTAVAAHTLEQEKQKALLFQKTYGGKIYSGYQTLLTSQEIDAVYLPLPPALHFTWAQKALAQKLHVFVEKPSTTSLAHTQELVNLARRHNLALHENYMFMFHSQLQAIRQTIKQGTLGKIYLYRIDFGFPHRPAQDFRYRKALGGGALLDCGGYTLKYANDLLGGNAQIVSAQVGYNAQDEVEVFGAGTLTNEKGDIAQVSFGMDNDYRCNIDIWGSKASLTSKRILTAPVGYAPCYEISQNGSVQLFPLLPDDAFLKSIDYFYQCISNCITRQQSYLSMLKQQQLVSGFAALAKLRLEAAS